MQVEFSESRFIRRGVIATRESKAFQTESTDAISAIDHGIVTDA